MALINYGSTVGRRGPVGPAPMRTTGQTATGPTGAVQGGRGTYLDAPGAVADYNAGVAAGTAGRTRPGVNLTADPFNDPSLDDDGVIFGGGSGGLTELQRKQMEAVTRGAGNQASYLSNLLTQAPNQYKTLLDTIAAQRTEQEGNVNTQYNTAIQNLKDRLAGAQTTTTAGYDALKAYLGANAPSAYSQLPQAQAPTLSPDAVLRYAQAIGAPTQAIGQAAVQAAAPYAGTADAYNRLLANLQASQANAQTSRMAEEQMARTLAGQGLTAQSTAQQNVLEGQRAAALDTILRQIQGQQLGVQQGQLGYEQGLQQALAGVYGTGYVAPPPPRNAAGEIDLSGVDFNALGRLMGLNK